MSSLGILTVGSYSRISFDVDVWNRVISHIQFYLISLFISETSQKQRDSVESPLQETGKWNSGIYIWMTA
jgi:hypothetical protein